MLPCKIEHCNNSHYARGLCKKHYQRVQRMGTTELPPKIKPILSIQRKRQAEIEEAFMQARRIVKPYRASVSNF